MRWTPRTAALITLLACGSDPLSRDAGAATAAGWSVTFFEGQRGAPVARLAVSVDGVPHTTDAQGRLRADVPPGALITTQPAGTLQRETVARGSSQLMLWPDTPTVPRGDTWSMVYRDAPGQMLTRIMAPLVSLVPGGPLRADAAAIKVLRGAALRMTAATGVQYVVADAALPGSVTFTVVLRSDLPASIFGHTDVHSHGAVIDGGVVQFRTLEAARRPNTVLHELGHTFGVLGHSSNPANVMYAEASPVQEFTTQEIVTFRMMARRFPGNRFPDADRALGVGPGRAALGADATAACD